MSSSAKTVWRSIELKQLEAIEISVHNAEQSIIHEE